MIRAFVAKNRKTGALQIVAGPETPPHEQQAKLEALYASGSDEFSGGGIFELMPARGWLEFSQPKKASMKKSILPLLIALVALAFTPSVFAADDYVPLSTPAGINTGATSNILQVIDVTKQAGVSFQLTFKGASGCTNGVQTLVFCWSNDRANWSTQTLTIGMTPDTNNVVSICTNLPTYNARYLRWNTWANGDSAAYMTNITATYALKPETSHP